MNVPSRMSAKQYQEFIKTGQVPPGAAAQAQGKQGGAARRPAGFGPSKPLPAGRRATHTPGKMNKTETRFCLEVLEPLRQRGEIEQYKFESLKLRLADKTYYTPDFLCVRPDLCYEIYEVKGHWEDDARVKIKVAAEQYPMFQFHAVRLEKGQWSYESF